MTYNIQDQVENLKNEMDKSHNEPAKGQRKEGHGSQEAHRGNEANRGAEGNRGSQTSQANRGQGSNQGGQENKGNQGNQGNQDSRMDEARSGIAAAANTVRETAEGWVDTVKDQTSHLVSEGRQYLSEGRQHLNEGMEGVRHAAQATGQRGQEAIDAVGQKVGQYPIMSILGAIGLGFMLGVLIDRTRNNH